MIGQTVSHYTILEKLGEGGMGVVYKAHDTKLDRIVALKFLPHQIAVTEEDTARFLQEARAISTLNHPNIATIFDLDEFDGQKFLVLEYLPGGTLKSHLKRLKSEDKEFSLGEVFEFGMQAAEALAHAHRHQIIHRDVKSDNLMLTEEGKVKLTDFGLAKLRGTAQVTKTGTTVGTAAYMSPEQVRGEEVDRRSDIFSLGVVLYELATSRLPFRGEFETALGYSILNEDPPPVTSLRKASPQALEKIIDRCLRKEKSERYQNAGEVAVALREAEQLTPTEAGMSKATNRVRLIVGGGIAAVAMIVLAYLLWPARPGAGVEKSIAVMPFVDMSPGKDQEYFCDGMTEELINRLTKVRDLRVSARTSAFMFKGKTEDVRVIGDKLNVQTVLEGSVRKAGNNLRVTAQLINAADGYHLWSETYDRELKDVFVIQDEVASAIVNALKPRLTAEERQDALATRHHLNPAAYNLYLQGRFLRYRNTREDVAKALPYFQQAIEKDSTSALAWSGLADIYMMIDLLSESQPQYHALSLAAARKSLALDPELPEAHIALAVIQMCYEWDWSGARQSIERAIDLNPSDPLSHVEHGILMQRMAKFEASIPGFQRSIELDPLAWKGYYRLGLSYSRLGNHTLAIESFKKAGEVGPEGWVEGLIGWEYFCQGSYDKARALYGNQPRLRLYVESSRGNRDVALEWISILKEADLNKSSAHEGLARAYACIGESDSAMLHLERLCELRPMLLVEINLWHEFDGLRSHPRFIALLRKIGVHE